MKPNGAPAVLSWLATGAWATPSRLRAYVTLWMLGQAGVAVAMAQAFARYSAAHGGKPVATDFMTFWSAAALAVRQGGAAAYADATRVALQVATGAMEPGGHYAYWYPPPFLLLTEPLGLLPYATAATVFAAAGYAVLFAVLRAIIGRTGPALALTLSPVMLLNTLAGQNGPYTAAIYGMALLLIARRPALAGGVLGLLVCKPHLGVLAPVLLLASGRWRALAGFVASAAALMAASAALLGLGAWRAFLAHSAEATAILRDFAPDFAKIQSAFAAVRLLGGGAALAFAVQAAAIAMALGVLLAPHLRAWHRRPAIEGAADIAVLAAASLFATPYMFDYDLTVLLVPLAWLLRQARASAPRPWEMTIIALLYVLPVGVRMLAATAAVPLTPLVLPALLLILARRRTAA